MLYLFVCRRLVTRMLSRWTLLRRMSWFVSLNSRSSIWDLRWDSTKWRRTTISRYWWLTATRTRYGYQGLNWGETCGYQGLTTISRYWWLTVTRTRYDYQGLNWGETCGYQGSNWGKTCGYQGFAPGGYEIA